jgi:hypothetical protein
MRAPAGFHTNQAALQVNEVRHHVLTLQLLAQYSPSSLIYTVNLENVLGQINANCRNLYLDASFQISGRLQLFHFGTSMPFQKGGVHPIRFIASGAPST